MEKIRRCLTCRKKLVGEKLPVCIRCRLTGRNYTWNAGKVFVGGLAAALTAGAIVKKNSGSNDDTMDRKE